MTERIAVGDFVRLNQDNIGNVHPRATDADVGAHTAAYVVTAYDKETKIATVAKQGKPFGDYPEAALVKVEAPIDNTLPPPPPPDTMGGGVQGMAVRAVTPPFTVKK